MGICVSGTIELRSKKKKKIDKNTTHTRVYYRDRREIIGRSAVTI